MASAYPSSIDNFVTNHVVGETILPTTDNDQADALNKIELELGTDPSGASATVKARLDGMPTLAGDNALTGRQTVTRDLENVKLAPASVDGRQQIQAKDLSAHGGRAGAADVVSVDIHGSPHYHIELYTHSLTAQTLVKRWAVNYDVDNPAFEITGAGLVMEGTSTAEVAAGGDPKVRFAGTKASSVRTDLLMADNLLRVIDVDTGSAIRLELDVDTGLLVAKGNLRVEGRFRRDWCQPTNTVAETIDRNVEMASKAVLTSGTLFVTAVALEAGDVVNTITLCSGSTALAAGSNQWFCLIRQSDLAVLGKTADDGATAWAANTRKALTLTAPVTIAADGMYYVGCVVVATTVPTLMGTSTVGQIASQAPIHSGTSTAGLTNPASLGATAGAVTVSANNLYAKLT